MDRASGVMKKNEPLLPVREGLMLSTAEENAEED